MKTLTRKDLYLIYHRLTPEEIAGASDIEIELDIRGITGDGCYEIPNYCTNKSVYRCSECYLANYNRDCHNNIVAKD